MNNDFQNNNQNQFPNNNMNNNYQNNNSNQFSNNNEANKPKNYIKNIVIIIGIILVFIILIKPNNTNQGNNNTPANTETNNNESNSTQTTTEDLEKNISINSIKSSAKGEEIIIIKNNNSESINIRFDVEMYDANNNVVTEKNNTKTVVFNALAPGEEAIAKSSSNTYPTCDHIKAANLEISKTNEKKLMNANQYIEIVSDEIVNSGKFDQVKVTLKNTYEKTIDNVDLSILFYNDNDLLELVHTVVYSMEGGQTETKTILPPSNKNGDALKFTKYKIYIHADKYITASE